MEKVGERTAVWYGRYGCGDLKGMLNGHTVVVIWAGNKRYVGQSWCSAEDKVDRKKGRLIALERAKFVMDKRRSHASERGWPKYFEFDVSAPDQAVKEEFMNAVPPYLYLELQRNENSDPVDTAGC